MTQEQMQMLQAQILLFKRFAKIANKCFKQEVPKPGSELSAKEAFALDNCVDREVEIENVLIQKLQEQTQPEGS